METTRGRVEALGPRAKTSEVAHKEGVGVAQRRNHEPEGFGGGIPEVGRAPLVQAETVRSPEPGADQNECLPIQLAYQTTTQG